MSKQQVISEEEKQNVNDMLDQLITLGKEFQPKIKELLGLYFGAIAGSTEFDSLVTTGMAGQLAKAMITSNPSFTNDQIALRSVAIAKTIVKASKE